MTGEDADRMQALSAKLAGIKAAVRFLVWEVGDIGLHCQLEEIYEGVENAEGEAGDLAYKLDRTVVRHRPRVVSK